MRTRLSGILISKRSLCREIEWRQNAAPVGAVYHIVIEQSMVNYNGIRIAARHRCVVFHGAGS